MISLKPILLTLLATLLSFPGLYAQKVAVNKQDDTSHTVMTDHVQVGSLHKRKLYVALKAVATESDTTYYVSLKHTCKDNVMNETVTARKEQRLVIHFDDNTNVVLSNQTDVGAKDYKVRQKKNIPLNMYIERFFEYEISAGQLQTVLDKKSTHIRIELDREYVTFPVVPLRKIMRAHYANVKDGLGKKRGLLDGF